MYIRYLMAKPGLLSAIPEPNARVSFGHLSLDGTTTMAAKIAVTDAQIVAAGNALVNQGRAVSASGLRAAIGAGDPARLFGVWQRHIANAPLLSGLPGEVEHLVAQSTSEIASALSCVARVLDAKISAAYAAELEDVQARHIAEKGHLQDQLKAAIEQAEAAAVRAAELEAQMRAAEVLADQLMLNRTNATLELQDLRARLDQSAAGSLLLSKQLVEHRAKQAVAEHRLGDAVQLVAQLEGRARDQEITINALSDQAGEMKAKIRYLEGEARNLTQARDNALTECEALRLLTGRQHQVLLAQGQALPDGSMVPSR